MLPTNKVFFKRLIFNSFFWIVLICVGSVQLIFAQANALVMGKIENRGLVKTMDLNVNLKYIDGSYITYTSKILEDNTFAFAVELQEPQLVTLTYSRNPGAFYLEPGDTVIINCDGNSFQYSFEFSGRGQANNEFYADFSEENPVDASPFTQVMYKQNTYWYRVNQDIDMLMARQKQEEFSRTMELQREKNLAELGFYQGNNPNGLSDDFKDFMNTEIMYRYAFHMLLYGNVYKRVHSITPEFFDFLDDVPLDNAQIGNHWYREFLMAYLDYTLMKDETKENSFLNLYDLATEQFGGSTLAFLQSEIIAKSLLKNIDATMPKYLDFIENNPYTEFDEKVLTAYQKARKNAIGFKAPEFALMSIDSQLVKLSDYKDKTVMLNFWASWCRPCIAKMNEMKLLQDELEQKGVVFINISLDRSKDAWKESIDKHQFTGVQLFAPNNIDSDVAYAYDVAAIPQYFLIDKRGTFAEKPKSFSMNKIKETLAQMVR